jgi:putative spermidine/putrescine transport system permease protein
MTPGGPTPARRLRGLVFWLYVATLFGPFLPVFILAFQTPLGGLTFPMDGVSLTWFRDLIHPRQLMDLRPAIGRSLALAAAVTLVCVPVSLLAALAFRRGFPGATLLLYVVVGSLIIPSILVSIGVGLLFQRLGLPFGWWSSALGAVLTWTLPFGVLILVSVLRRLDPAYEEAARDLGASGWQVFRFVTLPLALPAVIGVALTSFTLAYDEFPRSSMVAGPADTLPLELVAFMTIRASPAIYALGTVTTLVSFALVGLVLLAMVRLARARRGSHDGAAIDQQVLPGDVARRVR